MNVKIRNIEIQNSNGVLDNRYFIDVFKKYGKDIRRLLEVHGRNERKIVTDTLETTVTLGVKAALKVIKSSGLDGTDIEMISKEL